MFDNFPEGKFDVVLLDPAWKYWGDPNKDQACGKHYPCLTFEELVTLPVLSLEPEVVFCWTTSPMLETSLRLFSAWNLVYRGVAFVWVKTSQRGIVIDGQGVRPTVTKSMTEYVLVASRTARGRPLPISDEGVGQVVMAPRGRHSEKPDAIQDRIDRLYPHASKAELFARRSRPGWTCWGNQIGTVTTVAEEEWSFFDLLNGLEGVQ